MLNEMSEWHTCVGGWHSQRSKQDMKYVVNRPTDVNRVTIVYHLTVQQDVSITTELKLKEMVGL